MSRAISTNPIAFNYFAGLFEAGIRLALATEHAESLCRQDLFKKWLVAEREDWIDFGLPVSQ